jgi:hypothetical protein
MAKKLDKCICDQCPRRFVCFTQKKVFSDTAYQTMYEAYIEEGLDSKEAAKKVREFIETTKTSPWSSGEAGDGDKADWKNKWVCNKLDNYNKSYKCNNDVDIIQTEKDLLKKSIREYESKQS